MDYELRAKEVCPNWMCIEKGNTVRFSAFNGSRQVDPNGVGNSKGCFVIIDGKKHVYTSVVNLIRAMGWPDDGTRKRLKTKKEYRGYRIGFVGQDD